ncbi:hypothetical protein LCGC14_0320130 [marine sediment metagenome]|uniref:Uncharacterized protein n=1 Tax=marine sediment metagenome TaxID=412755 RepID=A0A0F9TJL8_9ZZZZ
MATLKDRKGKHGPDTFEGERHVFIVALPRKKFEEKDASAWVAAQGYSWKVCRHNEKEWQYVQRRAAVFEPGSLRRVTGDDGDHILILGTMRTRAVKVVKGDVRKRAQDRIAQRKRLKPKEARDAIVVLLEHFGLGGTVGYAGDQLDMQGKQAAALIRTGVEEQYKSWASANHRDNFVRYISFQIGVIRKLEHACKLFMEDPDSKQYNALVSACKAQSDIYERLFDRGVAMGVIETRAPETHKASNDRTGMIATLRKELSALTDLVAELEVEETQTTRTRRVKIKASRGGATARGGLGTLTPGSGDRKDFGGDDTTSDDDLEREVEAARAATVPE